MLSHVLLIPYPGPRPQREPGTRDNSALLRWDRQLLSHLNLVRIIQLVAIRVEDPHVLVRVSVKLLADLRQIVAGLNGVGLSTLARAAAGRRAHRATAIDGDIGRNVVSIWIDELDLIPKLVFRVF